MSVAALQRSAGNQAVVALMQQRSLARSVSTPPPSASEPVDAEVMVFEGRALRFDREVLVGVLRSIEEQSGLDARSAFIGRFRAAGVSPMLLRGTERPGLYQDILKGLDDAAAALDHEHEEFCRQFEAQAIAAAQGILNDSEAKLRAERERLGDKAQGGRLKAAALELVPHATMVDKLARESAAALEQFTKASANDPFGLTTKPLFEESESRRKRWQEASEAYEAERRPRVAAQPSLAMYADQPGAAEKLRRLSAMSDDEVGATATAEIDERLENIATVRPEIGAGFKVWGQSHLRRVTLDQMQATPLQRSIVDRKVRMVAGAGDDKTLFMLLAIGLGILAAIPSGGSSLVAGIAAAAAAAGAGLALYEVGKEIDQYSLAAAANATDFDKAKAISGNEPDAMNLALAVVGAVADVFAAAHAFKTLKGVFLAAKAGDVKAAIKFVELADGVGVQGATKQQLVGEAVASLDDAAIEATATTVARSGGMTGDAHFAKLLAGLSEHKQFKGELQAAAQLMDHVQGRIPDAAREMVASGRVRVFSEASLIDAFGPERGAEKWARLSYADGMYDRGSDLIFLKGGKSGDQLAGELIHEATHRLGKANPLRGNDFTSEAVAEFAERDFYISLYHKGGPLEGRPPSAKVKRMLDMEDSELLADIEQRYFAAKQNMDPAKRAKFKNITGQNAEDIVKEVFDDIAADYQAHLPKP